MNKQTDIWNIRFAIYRHFIETARAPGVGDIAAACGLTKDETRQALLALDEIHAVFLDPGTFNIHIANPFSGVQTDFLVTVNGQTYWANCAWDSFGIIAALQANAGEIEARCTEDGSRLRLAVRNGEAVNHGEKVHFLVPFSEWYEDMVFT